MISHCLFQYPNICLPSGLGWITQCLYQLLCSSAALFWFNHPISGSWRNTLWKWHWFVLCFIQHDAGLCHVVLSPGRGGRVRGKFRSYWNDSIIWGDTFCLAVPPMLIFSHHPLSVQHVCLDKGCLYLWWECAKFREDWSSAKITFISREIKGWWRMFGGTARKAVPSYIFNNEILAADSDNLFPVCTRTQSITHGCAKSLNSTQLLRVPNCSAHARSWIL